MTTNPYTLLIEMKLDGDYISQEAAVSFAKEYARLELERITKQKLNIEPVMRPASASGLGLTVASEGEGEANTCAWPCQMCRALTTNTNYDGYCCQSCFDGA